MTTNETKLSGKVLRSGKPEYDESDIPESVKRQLKAQEREKQQKAAATKPVAKQQPIHQPVQQVELKDDDSEELITIKGRRMIYRSVSSVEDWDLSVVLRVFGGNIDDLKRQAREALAIRSIDGVAVPQLSQRWGPNQIRDAIERVGEDGRLAVQYHINSNYLKFVEATRALNDMQFEEDEDGDNSPLEV